MIGQKTLIERFKDMSEFPHFIILVGMKGSGKKTLADTIYKYMNGKKVSAGVKAFGRHFFRQRT